MYAFNIKKERSQKMKRDGQRHEHTTERHALSCEGVEGLQKHCNPQSCIFGFFFHQSHIPTQIPVLVKLEGNWKKSGISLPVLGPKLENWNETGIHLPVFFQFSSSFTKTGNSDFEDSSWFQLRKRALTLMYCKGS